MNIYNGDAAGGHSQIQSLEEFVQSCASCFCITSMLREIFKVALKRRSLITDAGMDQHVW